MAEQDMQVEEVVSDGLTLDLTNSHLPTLAAVPLASTLTALDLTANRLKSLEPNLLALQGLRTLSLRQNLLEDASDIAKLASAPQLTELILQDNRLTEVPQLTPLTALQRLELSYNAIKSLAPLTSLRAPNLKDLYVASNRISSVDGVEHLTTLTLLELGSNRVKSLQPVAALTNLQELWLGRNRISDISPLSSLTNLRRLALLSNRLESMVGLTACTALQELYLSHNGISVMEGFETLTSLKILDVSNNRLTSLPSMAALPQLQDLWLNDNELADWPALLQKLTELRETLACLYLANNPATSEMPAIEVALRQRGFPKLEQLDDKIFPAAGGGSVGGGPSIAGAGRKLGTS